MKTTVTLESDVVRRLREVCRIRQCSFDDAINITLRQSLVQTEAKPIPKPYYTKPENMGVYAHLNYDNIGELLETPDKPTTG